MRVLCQDPCRRRPGGRSDQLWGLHREERRRHGPHTCAEWPEALDDGWGAASTAARPLAAHKVSAGLVPPRPPRILLSSPAPGAAAAGTIWGLRLRPLWKFLAIRILV